jgi:peptidoglycan/xylan/chitin deacetylase (PgdA/CDA1 family)
MYHYIRDASGESQLGKNLSVNPTNFDLHLKWLQDNDYESLTVADLSDPDKKILSQIIGEGKKPVIITFDDGYEDAYTNALPVLEKYKMTATFYVIRDYVGRPEYMNQKQIDSLEKAGFEIGSHTLSHPDLTKISLEDGQKQISDSKEDSTTFCYPAGRYNDTTVDLIKKAGYKAAVTTHFGIADQDSLDLELPRVRVEESSGQALGNKINAAYK